MQFSQITQFTNNVKFKTNNITSPIPLINLAFGIESHQVRSCIVWCSLYLTRGILFRSPSLPFAWKRKTVLRQISIKNIFFSKWVVATSASPGPGFCHCHVVAASWTTTTTHTVVKYNIWNKKNSLWSLSINRPPYSLFSLSTFGTDVHVVICELLAFRLHQVMLRRHQGLVLDHCKNEHKYKYKNTKIPGSLHLQWARGEEYSWSSWRCQSVATASSSHPVGKKRRYKNKASLNGTYICANFGFNAHNIVRKYETICTLHFFVLFS